LKKNLLSFNGILVNILYTDSYSVSL